MKKLQETMRKESMMSNPWEDHFSRETDGHVTMAQIVVVNPERRTCDIKTYGSDPLLANADWTDVQWLSSYGSPEGDEVSFVPRAGALCIVLFVNSTPWILGFFHPVAIDSKDEPADLEGEGLQEGDAQAAANANKEKINAGDLIWRTIGNCRIVLRAGGEIEIEATKVCKRTMFPEKNRVTDICRNYEFAGDGGTIVWVDHPDDDTKTICTQIWRDDISSTNIIKDTRGTVEINSDVIHRFEIKQGEASAVGGGTVTTTPPAVLKEVKNSGETLFQINKDAYEKEILEDGDFTEGINDYTYFRNTKPSGETRININNNMELKVLASGETSLDIGIDASKASGQKPDGGEGKFHLNIKPSGETTLDINKKANLSIKDSGETTLDVGPGNHTTKIDPDGKTTITVKQAKLTMEPSGDIEIDGSGNTITIKASGDIEVKAATKVKLEAPQIIFNNQGSGITTANSHQNVIDFITGIPCIPSTTTFGDI